MDGSHDPSVQVDARPAGWPPGSSVPRDVQEAWRTLASAREALQRERRAFDAEIRIAPSADLLARDDPPRPAQLDLELRPEASLAWSPLRSEVLLAEARVLEAEAAWIDAWREATVAVRRRSVELARARAELDGAMRVVERLEALVSDDTVAGSAGTSAAEGDDPALAERAFDLREARLDRDDAAAEVRAIEASLERLGPLPPPSDGLRPAPVVPLMPDPVETRAYRALALRSAADVARNERRWRDAIVPLLAFELGYAGADARVEGEVELRYGRPSARLEAALVGTPQERGWARLSAAFRIGTDLGPARAKLTEARLDEVERLAAYEQAWYARWDAALRSLAARRARWRLAEDRLAGAPDGDRPERLRDRARRAWLRMASAYETLLELAEAWPAWHDPPAADERAHPTPA